ncbi:hypothetical protein JY651_18180 [Pyxidicoccus parkwayensis]|uniref:Uncharacterized protein n=1 Tax=Pyxidicoccus parkwayensis TaxID=2813578 RepID=A0ABX7P8B6_9BACT|nr:hypothetical protein [Pyxidicoccus parkwaysis]QSQ26734.1 hypothetical protein JY651_18180 [Pyxidicoccus parkwaysis]
MSEKELEARAANGELLAIHTSADGSYRVRIVVDEDFHPAPEQHYLTLERELGIHLESGTAIVGGCEDFRRKDSMITSEVDQIPVAPSWYRARIHVEDSDGELREARAHDEAEKALTPAELATYRSEASSNRSVLVLCVLATAISFAALVVHRPIGFVIGAIAAALILTATWQRRRRRGDTYERMHARYQSAFDAAFPPDFVLELHRTEAPLPGGSVELEDVLSMQSKRRA